MTRTLKPILTLLALVAGLASSVCAEDGNQLAAQDLFDFGGIACGEEAQVVKILNLLDENQDRTNEKILEEVNDGAQVPCLMSQFTFDTRERRGSPRNVRGLGLVVVERIHVVGVNTHTAVVTKGVLHLVTRRQRVEPYYRFVIMGPTPADKNI